MTRRLTIEIYSQEELEISDHFANRHGIKYNSSDNELEIDSDIEYSSSDEKLGLDNIWGHYYQVISGIDKPEEDIIIIIDRGNPILQEIEAYSDYKSMIITDSIHSIPKAVAIANALAGNYGFLWNSETGMDSIDTEYLIHKYVNAMLDEEEKQQEQSRLRLV